MPNLTKHSEKRIKERAGVTKGISKSVNKKAFKIGILPSETTGELYDFIKSYVKKNPKKQLRVYGSNIYIYQCGNLVTVLDIPDEIAGNLQDYVMPEAYLKYVTLKKGKTLFKAEGLFEEIIKNYFADNNIDLKRTRVKINVKDKSINIKYFFNEIKEKTQVKMIDLFDAKYGVKVTFKEELGLANYTQTANELITRIS